METMRAFISENLLGFATLLAALVGAGGIVSQRIITARRATIELISHFESHGGLGEAKKIYNELVSAGGAGLTQFAEEKHWGSPQTEAIRVVLNQFELVSIGVQRGILDFELYRRWYKAGVLRHWDQSSLFIVALRKRMNNPLVYNEFEQLVDWMSGKKRPKRSRWLGLFF
jgi:hypothetical protein